MRLIMLGLAFSLSGCFIEFTYRSSEYGQTPPDEQVKIPEDVHKIRS